MSLINIPSLMENLIGIKAKIGEITGISYDKRGNIIINAKGNRGKDINVPLTFNINIVSDVIPYMQKLSKLEKEKYKKDNFHFTRSDLIPFIAESRLPNEKYEGVLTILKPHLIKNRPFDFGALRAAATICKLEDEGTNEIEVNKLRQKLLLGHKCKWDHVLYNWLRCGEIFEQEIIPHMNFCLTITDNTKDFEKLFFPFWEQRLSFHPTKIFVPMYMPENKLFFGLSTRLVDNKEKEIKVYSRSSRNKLANKVINNFIRKNNNFEKEVKKYKLGLSDARTFIIKS